MDAPTTTVACSPPGVGRPSRAIMPGSAACTRRERRSAADADELCELARAGERLFAHDADPRAVDLLVVGSGLDPRGLEAREHVAHLPIRARHRAGRADDPGGVLRLSRRALLPLGVGDLRIRLHAVP